MPRAQDISFSHCHTLNWYTHVFWVGGGVIWVRHPHHTDLLSGSDKHLIQAPREDHVGGIADIETRRRAATDGISLCYAPNHHTAKQEGGKTPTGQIRRSSLTTLLIVPERKRTKWNGPSEETLGLSHPQASPQCLRCFLEDKRDEKSKSFEGKLFWDWKPVNPPIEAFQAYKHQVEQIIISSKNFPWGWRHDSVVSSKHLLPFWRTAGWFPAPTSTVLQPPVTRSVGSEMASSYLCWLSKTKTNERTNEQKKKIPFLPPGCEMVQGGMVHAAKPPEFSLWNSHGEREMWTSCSLMFTCPHVHCGTDRQAHRHSKKPRWLIS